MPSLARDVFLRLTGLPPPGAEPEVGAAGHPGEDLAHGVDHVDHGPLVLRQLVVVPHAQPVVQELTSKEGVGDEKLGEKMTLIGDFFLNIFLILVETQTCPRTMTKFSTSQEKNMNAYRLYLFCKLCLSCKVFFFFEIVHITFSHLG